MPNDDSSCSDTRQHWFRSPPHPIRRTTALDRTCDGSGSTRFRTCADRRQHLFHLPVHLIRDAPAVVPLTSAPVPGSDNIGSDTRQHRI
jgi:hypothetical protein